MGGVLGSGETEIMDSQPTIFYADVDGFHGFVAEPLMSEVVLEEVQGDTEKPEA